MSERLNPTNEKPSETERNLVVRSQEIEFTVLEPIKRGLSRIPVEYYNYYLIGGFLRKFDSSGKFYNATRSAILVVKRIIEAY